MRKLLAAIGIIGMLGMVLAPVATASAQPETAESCRVSQTVIDDYADTCGGCPQEWSEDQSDNPTCQPICCVLSTIENVGTWFFWIVLIIAFIMLLWGAVLFMTAGGDEEQTGDARRTLIYALVGVAVAYLSRLLIQMAANLMT